MSEAGSAQPQAASEQSSPRGSDAGRIAILDAAERIFCHCGFHEGSLARVAREAGVAKSLIHHHFGSKEKLWQAVVERRFADYAAVQRALMEQPDPVAAENMSASVRAFFAFLADNPEFVRLHALANAGQGAGDGGFDAGHALCRQGVSRMHEHQRSGAMAPDLHPAAILATLFCAVEHWFQAKENLRARFGEDMPDDREYLETVARILVRGMQP